MQTDLYDRVIELARRRGFLWNSFELYGGAAGFYDYGPLGAILKRAVEDLWREFFVLREGFFEIESPTIGIEDVFRASGHLSGFSDPITECIKCNEPFRADHLLEGIVSDADGMSTKELEELIRSHNISCPECSGELGGVYDFNLMFETTIGPGKGRRGYLRPETAQGMFVNFPRLLRFYREKLPFGAVQIGKSYRNEISPRQGVLRLREFTQAEAEIFIDPTDKTEPRFKDVASSELTLYPASIQEAGEEPIQMRLGEAVAEGTIAHESLAYYINLTYEFLTASGIDPKRLRFRQHRDDEMAHYAADCWDAEAYLDRFGWVELVGIADRTDYDLQAHTRVSGMELGVFKEYEKPKRQKVIKIKPKMNYIGPKFKKRAKQVVKTLEKLSLGEISGETITIEVDGEEIRLGSEAFTIETLIEEISGEKIIPHVVEPSFGLDRIIYTILEHSYREETVEDEVRKVMELPEKIAPIKAAVLPLLTKDELITPAKKIETKLKENGIQTTYDDSGTIGRRYRRNDEIGTPYAITIDYTTLEDETVTIRDRTTMKQIRRPIKEIEYLITRLIRREEKFNVL
ncbi:glycine--tRNA ligase [Methanosarcinales archaeon]|nr:MAG: glycine--tRNA ligase [Methanosarcinales archaeon]